MSMNKYLYLGVCEYWIGKIWYDIIWECGIGWREISVNKDNDDF